MTEESRGPGRPSSEDDDLLPGLGHGRRDAAGTGATADGREAVDGPQQASDLDDVPVDDPPPAGPETGQAGQPAGPGLSLDKDREPGAGAADDDPAWSPAPGSPGVADQLVAGFAPPDSYTRDTDIPAPPPATAIDQPLSAGPGGPGSPGGPGGPGAGPGAGEPVGHEMVPDGIVPDGPVPPGPGPDQGRHRPGFVPHGYEPEGRMPAAHQQPGDPRAGGQGTPYGWPPQQSPQPPPLAGRPPAGGPPPGAVPMGMPPGGPRPMGPPGGPGQPPGGVPNWAPVPSLPSASRGAPGLGALAVVALIVALVAGGLGAGIGVMATGDGSGPGSVSLGGDNSGQVKNRPPDSVAGVAQKVLPSVVMIRVSSGGEGGTGGTGFIVNGGYIITNNHVVAQGGDIQIVFNDKKTLPGTIKGRDPRSDIAVLKPEGQHTLPPLTPGNSDQLAVGDPVIAIGSPLGLQGSVTTGIVSSLNRAVPTGGEGGGETAFLNAIQTDAAINPGNSGGPLVDGKGRVIGINTAIVSLGGGMGGQGQAGNIGLGFAIPINQGKRVAEAIINTGSVKQAMMGVVPDPRYQQGGARIMEQATGGQEPVTKNGPADKAGLKPGDVITKIDGRPIEDATDLIALIRSKAPGDQVKVTYTRGGKEATADVTLASG
ncbi:hypothetical protein GCM10010191_34420 [Actinomadura vinacea]|uniref:PDZ domain-containing protein n=1 Tax=Actinomadura vinacea TaxID=115336 RepID=A0ABP5W5E7_9ACTN